MHYIHFCLQLFFIDYGSVATLPSKGICFLHTDFSTLPQQAIRARLAGIYPINTDSQWTRASARSFLNLVRNKTLVAQVHSVDEKVFVFCAFFLYLSFCLTTE